MSVIRDTIGGTAFWRRRGTGATLVCLHGIGSHGDSFLTLLPHLPDDWDVIAWTAPGYDGSADLALEGDRQAAWPSEHAYAARLTALLGSLDTGPVTLLGHSLGALVARALRCRPFRSHVAACAGRSGHRATARRRVCCLVPPPNALPTFRPKARRISRQPVRRVCWRGPMIAPTPWPRCNDRCRGFSPADMPMPCGCWPRAAWKTACAGSRAQPRSCGARATSSRRATRPTALRRPWAVQRCTRSRTPATHPMSKRRANLPPRL